MSAALQAPQVGEKFAPQAFIPCGMEDLRRYADASGDSNPIHLDEELARKAGLPGAPVHGMLLMSRFVPLLAAWRPDLSVIRLSTKFIRPVYVGETGEFSGRVAQVSKGERTTFLLRLMMHNEKRELTMLAEAVTIQKPGA